jgi:predicted aspartyl protease
VSFVEKRFRRHGPRGDARVMTRRLSALVGWAAALAAIAPAASQPLAPGAETEQEVVGYAPDEANRMTVPVSIAGRGPFDFVVDTGSERTVVSHELARELGLGAGAPAVIHSMTELRRVPTVMVAGLSFGQRTIDDIRAPALAERDLGAAGLLGLDSLQRQRVVFDFVRREMTISPARLREEEWPEGTIVVTGRSRFGRLVLMNASVDGERVQVVLDTGSQVTVGNTALRQRLARRGRLSRTRPIQLLSVTGGTIDAEYGATRLIRIGGVDIRDLPIAFAEVHPFRQLGLSNRPALLLGMDALELFDRISVDFANRRVRLLLPDSSGLQPPLRMAAAARPAIAP